MDGWDENYVPQVQEFPVVDVVAVCVPELIHGGSRILLLPWYTPAKMTRKTEKIV